MATAPLLLLCQPFLLPSGHWLPCCLQFSLILFLKALQIHSQAVRVQPGVPGSLQESVGQVVLGSLLQCFWITTVSGLEKKIIINIFIFQAI